MLAPKLILLWNVILRRIFIARNNSHTRMEKHFPFRAVKIPLVLTELLCRGFSDKGLLLLVHNNRNFAIIRLSVRGKRFRSFGLMFSKGKQLRVWNRQSRPVCKCWTLYSVWEYHFDTGFYNLPENIRCFCMPVPFVSIPVAVLFSRCREREG